MVRVRRLSPSVAPSIDELECFAAKYFEKFPERTKKLRYVQDVYLNDTGVMHVEYGEVDVPLR